MSNQQFRPAIAIHGGAGTILRSIMRPEQEKEYHHALKAALESGYNILQAGGSSLDAVVAAVESLEDCPLFNAGRGAVFTNEGKHELDAAVMIGNSRAAGAVASVSGVRNPVRLARAVMEHSEHVLLAGAGAEQFAKSRAIAFEPEDYFFTRQRYDQWQEAMREGVVQLDHRDDKKLAPAPGPITRPVRFPVPATGNISSGPLPRTMSLVSWNTKACRSGKPAKRWSCIN
jgi:beta-aspartyl-peptidase (threonine type)